MARKKHNEAYRVIDAVSNTGRHVYLPSESSDADIVKRLRRDSFCAKYVKGVRAKSLRVVQCKNGDICIHYKNEPMSMLELQRDPVYDRRK